MIDFQIDLQQWAYGATLAGAALTFLVGAATVAVLVNTLNLTKQSKRSDSLSEFNRRFNQIWEMRHKSGAKANQLAYFCLFWNLQFDQFHAWQQGLVTDETFTYWCSSRSREWIQDKPILEDLAPAEQIKYRDAYTKVTADWIGSDFTDFMKVLHERGAPDAIERYRPRKASFRGRNS
ncbi:hypothetical protein ACWFRB_15230 [Rhodococcus sp. NPDC055112]